MIYKNVGETPKEVIVRLKKENPEFEILPMTYAGRLDPMAEGLMVILSGESIFKKDEYLDFPKTYEFEIMWGFETDTADLLGKIKNETNTISEKSFDQPTVLNRSKNAKNMIPKISEIKKHLRRSIGKFEQLYPIYSSRPVGGKSLFEWAREGRISEVDILAVKFMDRKVVRAGETLEKILEKIDLVKGDFRQEEIKKSWQKSMSRLNLDSWTVDKVEIEVSSGFYVRQFVTDLGRGLGTSALAYSIKRTKVGDMSLANIKSKG